MYLRLVVFPQSPTLTTDDELAEVRAAIESQRVRFVVVPFLFRAVFGKGNRAVERYLLEHYRPVSGDSPTLILERKPTPRAGVVPGTARVSVLAETTIGRERSGMRPKSGACVQRRGCAPGRKDSETSRRAIGDPSRRLAAASTELSLSMKKTRRPSTSKLG